MIHERQVCHKYIKMVLGLANLQFIMKTTSPSMSNTKILQQDCGTQKRGNRGHRLFQI